MRLLCLKNQLKFAAAAVGLALLCLAEQPLPYSHKTHLKLGLKCTECHTMPGKGEAATFPSETKCMACHASIKTESPHIQKLTEFAKKKEPVPWVRVYRLPEFVWFSHKVHTKVTDCARCHAPKMNSCDFCHTNAEHRSAPGQLPCHSPGRSGLGRPRGFLLPQSQSCACGSPAPV